MLNRFAYKVGECIEKLGAPWFHISGVWVFVNGRLIIGLALLLSLATSAMGQEGLAPCVTVVPRDHHAWGRFGAGSWKLVRVVTETFDEHGRMVDTSTSETKTTLESANDWGYSLKIESSVEVAGKRFNVQPQIVSKGYNGEQMGQTVEIRELGSGNVQIDGQQFSSRICEVVVIGRDSKRISTVHYNERFAPFILRQATRLTEAEQPRPDMESLVDVVALDMPHRVLTETKSVAEVKTTVKTPKGETVTIELSCLEVPGGVVQHRSKETDRDGHVIRHSTLELLDYHAEPREPEPEPARRPGLFRRLRQR